MSEEIEQTEAPQTPVHTPKKGFLVAASFTVAGAVLSYIYQDEIIFFTGQETPMAFITLLIALLVFSMFFIMCYRNPKFGDSLLNRSIKVDDLPKENHSFHYSAGYKVESGADEKRLNSARKNKRATRKQLAETTRKMAEEGTLNKDEGN